MPSLPRARFDGDRCADSSSTIYVVVLGVLAFCSVLAIAVPLNTAGYNWRVAANGDLAPTQCTTVAHVTEASRCYRSCYCQQVHVGESCSGSGSMRTCTPKYRERCDQCPYTCYEAFWNVTYTTTYGGARAEPMHRWELVRENRAGRHSTLGGAMAALRAGHPVGSTTECFYRRSTLGDIVFSLYRPTPFLVFAIAFYALGAVCCACACLCGACALCDSCECDARTDSAPSRSTVFNTLPATATARRRRRSSRAPAAATRYTVPAPRSTRAAATGWGAHRMPGAAMPTWIPESGGSSDSDDGAAAAVATASSHSSSLWTPTRHVNVLTPAAPGSADTWDAVPQVSVYGRIKFGK